jgi:hypothetical protein
MQQRITDLDASIESFIDNSSDASNTSTVIANPSANLGDDVITGKL